MCFSFRRPGVMALALLLSGAMLPCTAQAQGDLNPYAGVPALGGAGWGWGGGAGMGMAAGGGSLINSAASYGGLGGLWGGFGGAGGYGGLYNGLGYGGITGGGPWGGIYGAFNPYLFGVMSNPYSGYLNGVASVTTANGRYEVLLQQAKKQRQENIRAVMENRIKQEEMENKIREMRRGNAIEDAKRDRAWALEEARRAPTQTDVWSGRTLNVLLGNLINEQQSGHRGPKVPLREDDLQSINLTSGSTRANMGLLRNIRAQHRLAWPLSLQNPRFAETRDKIDADLERAVKQLASAADKTVDPGTLNDLRGNLQQLRNQMEAAARVSDLSMQELIEAKRFLGMVSDALRALEDPTVASLFNQKWMTDMKSVGELVKFMRNNGLRFAPAVPGDEPAYTALYNAMRKYDQGMDVELASEDRK